MILRIDHIAIAVNDYEAAAHFFRDILGAAPGAHARVPDRNYCWQNLALGDLTRLELLAPTGPGGLLGGFLSTRVGGFHHITLQTPDLEAMIKILDDNGIPYFGKHEYPDGCWKEIFIHPRDAFGTLIQIAEFRADDWIAAEARMADGKRWEMERTETGATLSFAHPGGGKVRLEFTRDEMRDLSNAIGELLK